MTLGKGASIAMTRAFFATDLHGRRGRYRALLARVAAERPDVVLLGGDLLPSGWQELGSRETGEGSFLESFLLPELASLRSSLGPDHPRFLVILGNDDIRAAEGDLAAGEAEGLLEHVHSRRVELGDFLVLGYAFVPPTPFGLKDWERYDVSRHVDPGCVSPEEGQRSVPVSESEARYGTIARDLEALAEGVPLERAVMLFHAPPYDTPLDRAALDGKLVEHVPLDVHIGSVAIRRFIEERQPWLTLHGHVHESTRLTGHWRDVMGRTHMLQGAHDGPELALVRLDLEDPAGATRELIAPV